MTPYARRRAEGQAATKAARAAALAERRKRMIHLWPLMSIRDIASELDVTADAIQHDAHRLGLKSRPIGAQP
jgi:hypothetical protein